MNMKPSCMPTWSLTSVPPSSFIDWFLVYFPLSFTKMILGYQTFVFHDSYWAVKMTYWILTSEVTHSIAATFHSLCSAHEHSLTNLTQHDSSFTSEGTSTFVLMKVNLFLYLAPFLKIHHSRQKWDPPHDSRLSWEGRSDLVPILSMAVTCSCLSAVLVVMETLETLAHCIHC